MGETQGKGLGYLQKKAHMRAVFSLVAAVFVLLAALLVAFALQWNKAAQVSLESQGVAPSQSAAVVPGNNSDDPQQSVFAPDLVSLLGAGLEEAVESLGHGATVVSQADEASSDGNQYLRVSVALSNEPADSLTGTPTVYLLLDGEGTIVEAGYKAGMSYLGYGSLSFMDAVNNAHVVEETLTEAGLSVEKGQVSAPEQRSDYAIYASDGYTLESERYEFSGSASGHSWRAILDYEYGLANSTSNLANTIRLITVYVR